MEPDQVRLVRRLEEYIARSLIYIPSEDGDMKEFDFNLDDIDVIYDVVKGVDTNSASESSSGSHPSVFDPTKLKIAFQKEQASGDDMSFPESLMRNAVSDTGISVEEINAIELFIDKCKGDIKSDFYKLRYDLAGKLVKAKTKDDFDEVLKDFNRTLKDERTKLENSLLGKLKEEVKNEEFELNIEKVTLYLNPVDVHPVIKDRAGVVYSYFVYGDSRNTSKKTGKVNDTRIKNIVSYYGILQSEFPKLYGEVALYERSLCEDQQEYEDFDFKSIFSEDVRYRLAMFNENDGCYSSPYRADELADKVLKGRELDSPTKELKKLRKNETTDSKLFDKFGLSVAIARLEAEYNELKSRESAEFFITKAEGEVSAALDKKTIEVNNENKAADTDYKKAIVGFLGKFEGVEIKDIATLERLLKAAAPKMSVGRGGAAGNVYGDVHVDVDLSVTQVSQTFNHYGISIEEYMEDYPLELVEGKPNLVKFAVYCIDRVLSHSEQKARETIAECEPKYGIPFSVDDFMESLYVRDDDGKRIGLDPVNYPDVYATLLENMYDNPRLKKEVLSLKKQLEEKEGGSGDA